MIAGRPPATCAQELRWIADGGSQAGIPLTSPAKPRSRERLAWILAGSSFSQRRCCWHYRNYCDARRRSRAPLHSNVPPSEKNAFGNSSAISPDGRLLAFTATDGDGGKGRIWIRPLDSIEPKGLAGTEGAQFPFWSPDSRYLGFFADNKLKKIEVTGARPQTLCDVSQ